MPYKRRYKKQRRKRKRKRASYDKIAMPKKKTVAMRYVEAISLNPGAGGMANYVFRTNSLFEPDFTGVSHQPLFYDEISPSYESYRVIKSKIKVTPIASANAGVVPALWGVFKDDNTALDYTTGLAIIEDSRNSKNWGLSFNAPNQKYVATHLTSSFNAKRDLSPEAANNSVPVSSSPSSTEFAMYYQVWASSTGVNDPGALEFLIELEYVAEFTVSVHVAQS